MNDVILRARKAHRKATEMFYEHTCTIKGFESVKDPVSKVTKKQEVVLLENQPCRLSHSNVRSTDQTDSNASVQQVIKLFIAPEIIVKEGSRIFIEYEGRTTEFKHSGRPAVYPSHQEIILEVVENA